VRERPLLAVGPSLPGVGIDSSACCSPPGGRSHGTPERQNRGGVFSSVGEVPAGLRRRVTALGDLGDGSHVRIALAGSRQRKATALIQWPAFLLGGGLTF